MRASHIDPGIRPKPPRAPFGAAALAAGLIGFAVVLARTAPLPLPTKTAAPAAPFPAWIDIPHPMELFSLSAPGLSSSNLLYQARRHQTGGGRQDTLTFGTFTGGGPFLRLTLYRVGAEPVPQEPFFLEIARIAATANLAVTRSLASTELATRFGLFEAADIDLAVGKGAPMPCLGFRGAGLGGGFRISGFACGTPERPLSRPALACLLDRLDLSSAGDDASLAEFFAATELRRDPMCAGTGLGPTPIRANWIDQEDAPPLRLQKAH